jgi:hypothetical protein
MGKYVYEIAILKMAFKLKQVFVTYNLEKMSLKLIT